MKNIIGKRSTLLLSGALFCTSTSASDTFNLSKFAGTFGASYEAGQLGNSGMGLSDRTMTSVSFEALTGWRINKKLFVGLDFNYRLQQQQTSLSSTDGTNLAGKGVLIGLGANYNMNPRFSLQGAVDLYGKYNFDKQTSHGQDDHLKSPLSLRMKAQYFAFNELPLSLDASVSYIRWGNFHVEGVDHSKVTTQYMLGVGITYHFGNTTIATSLPNAVSPKETDVSSHHVKRETANVPPVQEEKTAIRFDLASDVFGPYSSEVNENFKMKLKEIGETLSKIKNKKILIRGYTDTSGSLEANNKISRERAESVRKILIENGVDETNIEAQGFGPLNPLADNKTIDGRKLNRRVEITIVDK